MASYTTIALVSAELNGFSITASSTPSSSVVTNWIIEASRDVELLTNQVWSSTTATSEYHDYDGSGFFFTYNKPIITITSLHAESNGINATTASWYQLLEGRTIDKDFIVYRDEGEIRFHGNKMPNEGYQNLCVTYTYGYNTTPTEIQRLATLLAAKRVIYSIVNGSATSEGGSISVGTISVSDPSTFGHSHIKNMDMEIESLLSSIGKLKTYRVDRI